MLKLKKIVVYSMLMIVIAFLASCGIKNKADNSQTDLSSNLSSEADKSNNNITKQLETENAVDNNNDQALKILPLELEDFGVIYNGKLITSKDSPEKIFETWGKGKVQNVEDAYVGPSLSGTFGRYEFEYAQGNQKIIVEMTKNVDSNEFELTKIDISEWGTKRKIKRGNTHEEMLNAYGKPTKEEDRGDGTFICKYVKDGMTLWFDINKDKKVYFIELYGSGE